MPVEVIGLSSKQRGTLVCEQCGARSKAYPCRSPAAPHLSACAAAEPDGWAFTIGFFAMLAGPRCICPTCKEA